VADPSTLFRKSALNSLSSPEQLDQLIQVTTPRAWIALAAGGLVLMAVLAWSVLGSLPTRVAGQGVIVSQGGVFDIVATGEGFMTDLPNLRIGDPVRKGQVIGRITQPALEQQIAVAQAELERLQAEQRSVRTAIDKESRLLSNAHRQQQDMQLQVIRVKEERLRSLKTVEQHMVELLAEGLIAEPQLAETRQSIFEAQKEIGAAKGRLQQLAVQQATEDSQHGERERGSASAVVKAQNRLNELQLQHRIASNVISTEDGVVVEVKAVNGEPVKYGQPILSIEHTQKKLQAMLYLPPDGNGKLIKPGMTAQISPSTHRKERDGFLIGKVVAVSKYPATEQGMLTVLDDPALVRELSRNGPPIAVEVDLVPDPRTASGYAWSSKAGARLELTSGTLCSGTLIIENKRPIGLVFPMLKSAVGL
jgi:HlyD family secretion protein